MPGIDDLAASNNNTIGGASANAGNLVADNGGPGVAVTVYSSVGDQITANRIFGNTGPAIDLGDDGVTKMGPLPREGPDELQNFPILFADDDGQTEGWLGVSEPDTTYRIDVYASAGYGPGGAGEAQDYLGSLAGDDRRDRGDDLHDPVLGAGGFADPHGDGDRSAGQHLRGLGPATGRSGRAPPGDPTCPPASR